MLDQFQKNLQNLQVDTSGTKWLIAVSGGIDSMVLMHLFSKSGYHAGIAHCNFQLRGDASDKDEELVKNAAKEANLPFYSVRFQTLEYARENGLSIQMAARNLRFEWFEKIRKANNYHYVALAHNSDDVLETFFINLSRGTGLRGLAGMPAIRDKFVRPLLFASREMIQNYQQENKIPFREDISNASVKYTRNKIRHQILPEFEKINAGFKENLHRTIQYLAEVQKMVLDNFRKAEKGVVKKEKNQILIDIESLKKVDYCRSFLWEFLREYNFSTGSLSDIINSMSGPPGKRFYSPTHRLIKDRNNFILTGVEPNDQQQELLIENGKRAVSHPISLDFEWAVPAENYEIPSDKNRASLDASKLTYPLSLRKWKEGDRFYPLGMHHSKKLSDFFTDKKLSLPQKENIWLLCSDDQIVWVIGHQIDNRFAVTAGTKKIVYVHFKA